MESNATEANQTAQNSTKGNKMQPKTLTGYKIAQMANKILEMEGLAMIKPQMVYNYIKNNLIPTNGPNGTVIDTDATKWIVKYVNAKKARQSQS